MNTKQFTLGDVLTVTTGRLVALDHENMDGNGIDRLYSILEWMTGEPPFTHQLGRFSEECRPWLRRWFTELQEAENHLTDSPNSLLSQIDAVKESGGDVTLAIKNWLSLCVSDWGMSRFYEVPKIPSDDHTRKDPVGELHEMMNGNGVD